MTHYKGVGRLIYLPVQWTAYQVQNDRNPHMMRKLQNWLSSLQRDREYFTIVQHDDGIKFNLPFKCKIFGMGSPQDYPLPLICEPHQFQIETKKDIFVSFVGAMTHPMRRKIPKIKHWYITNEPHSEIKFCNIMARSIFALCPRGYGVTSFRIMEALQYGAIPVYISDRHIIPHRVPFNQYGILLNDVGDIHRALTSMTHEEIEAKRARGKEVYEKYYTYESNLKLISDVV